VLVVEDDAALRGFYRTTLRHADYRVIAVEDGLDALTWIEQHTPDIIVLDLALLRVSGRDVQRELRAHAETRDIPIVVVTGDDTSDLNRRELACVLNKPVTGDALVEVVDRCLKRSPPGLHDSSRSGAELRNGMSDRYD
jgi:two-component system phosphate regulon response regulator PhoB